MSRPAFPHPVPVPSNRIGRRGLAAVAALLVGVLVLLDLLRADSFLRSAFDGLFGPGSFWRTFVDGLQRQWPRWR